MSKFKFIPLEVNSDFKVLSGKGEKGAEMLPHKVDKDGFLLVQAGEIDFKLDGKSNLLSRGESIKIPQNTIHAFTVIKVCEVVLILAADAKIEYTQA